MFYITDERQFEEDAIILKVIESYCHSVNARFTVHSGESNCKFLKANWFRIGLEIETSQNIFCIIKKLCLFFSNVRL